MQKISRCLILTGLVLSSLIDVAADDPANDQRIPLSDCHVHLVDFLQNGEFWSAEDEAFIPPSPEATLSHGRRGARIVSLLKRMEHANVTHAMVSGMPFVKKMVEE